MVLLLFLPTPHDVCTLHNVAIIPTCDMQWHHLPDRKELLQLLQLEL